MRQILDYQADQIEMVLHSHGIQGYVTGGTVTPRWLRFEVVLPADKRPEDVLRLRAALAHRLDTDVRVSEQSGRVVVELARADRQDVTLAALARRVSRPPEFSAILGLDDDGLPLLLHLPSATVTHCLVAGMTGSGKTILMRTMTASLARYNEPARLHLYIVDPLGRLYRDLAWLPHLPAGITTGLDDAVDVLGMLTVEMDRRSQSGELEPRVVVIIDELADLVQTTGQETLDRLTRLTARGRGAGIHVVAGTQKPMAAVIGSLVKANFPVRLVGSVASPEEAKIASGLSGTGAERLHGMGDFLLCQHGKPCHFQAALLDGEFLHYLRRDVRRAGYAGPHGDPLAEYREQVKSQLSVLPGGRQDEDDARRVIESPGFVTRFWSGDRLGYGHQTAIGEIVGQDNAGSGRARILRIADLITKILGSSTSSTTSTAHPRFPDGAKYG